MLGPFEVTVGDSPIGLGGRRQRAVLAILAIHANRVVSLDRLADLVWAGEPPRSAVATLQSYVSHLRRALSGSPLAIESRRPGYVLLAPADAIDVSRFERLVEQAREAVSGARPEDATALLTEALGLWRGAVLSDFAYEPFAEGEIARLENLRMVAVELRVEAELALGRHADLVGQLETLVAEHPLRESLRGLLMRALHGCGRRAEALRVFREARELLVEELGIEPGADLQRLEQAILLEDAGGDGGPARPPPPGNLPAATTSFVGRDLELREVAAHLTRHRLVTLTGPGGIGKTRLAVEVASELAALHADGAWLVELGAVTDGDTVPLAAASALGLAEEPGRDPVEGLCQALRRRDCLVVLDNCEHLVEPCAALADAVLRACPRVRILATSREALGIGGELAWRVPPLPAPSDGADGRVVVEYDAVRLFLDRAAAAFPEFEPDDEALATIAELCRRLDGIPLAIELATARLRVISVPQLAERLNDRFRLLVGGSRAALPRQRTLRATVEWSYDLLGDEERVLFDRASVFAGAFTVETAHVVCAGPDATPADTLDLLTALVDRSLLTRVQETGGVVRYRMLETLRAYAAERVAERDEARVLRDRHAAAYAGLAERASRHARGAAGPRWSAQLDADLDDLRAALEWSTEHGDRDTGLRLAAALWPFWDHRHHLAEGRAWLARAMGASPPRHHRATVHALVGAATLALLDDDLVRADALAEEARAAAAAASDTGAEARALIVTATVARRRGDPATAAELAREVVRLSDEIGDGWTEADALSLQAGLAAEAGDLLRATTLAQAALARWERGDDLPGGAWARLRLASLSAAQGDLDAAAYRCEEALSAFREAGHPRGTAAAVRGLAVTARLRGDVDVALKLGEDALRLHQQLGARRGLSRSLLVLADAALDAGDVDGADALAGAATGRLRDLGLSGDLPEALRTMARVALRRENPERAVRLCEEGLEAFRRHDRRREAGDLLTLLAVASARLGDGGTARAAAEDALAVHQATGDERGAAAALEALAEASLAAGDAERAATYLTAARTARVVADAPLAPGDLPAWQRLLAAVGDALGDTPFARSWHAELSAEGTPDR